MGGIPSMNWWHIALRLVLIDFQTAKTVGYNYIPASSINVLKTLTEHAIGLHRSHQSVCVSEFKCGADLLLASSSYLCFIGIKMADEYKVGDDFKAAIWRHLASNHNWLVIQYWTMNLIDDSFLQAHST